MDRADKIYIGLRVFLIFLIADSVMAVSVTNVANRTDITWAHAVNSKALLKSVLKTDVKMIEADIILGTLNGTGAALPVMGHPPNTTSDISLTEFLQTIQNFNMASKDRIKGVKLDFKSTEVFEGSLGLLTHLWNTMNYPVWINADIISGPLNNTETKPVDPDVFLTGCKSLPNSTLSVGWTTRWGSNFTDGNYTKDHVQRMVNVLIKNQLHNSTHPITFPVRAGIAAQSIDALHDLVSQVNKTNHNVTITIWSSPQDNVNIDALRKLIFSFGLDRVYVDVPEEVSSRLQLENALGCASSLIHFGIINFTIFLLSLYFSNYQP